MVECLDLPGDTLQTQVLCLINVSHTPQEQELFLTVNMANVSHQALIMLNTDVKITLLLKQLLLKKLKLRSSKMDLWRQHSKYMKTS